MTSKTLKVTTPSDREIAMTRVFDAPRALVFEALTKPELLKRWFGDPRGWALAVCEIDLRVGGAYRYVWRGERGEMGLSGIYKEITPPERIVATEAFDQGWYPGNNAVVTQTLSEHGGRTTLTLRVMYESKEARDAVLKTPMESGIAAAYDRLAEFLATQTAR
jgi:uncharacterized protein YndB with AHSA1/START domain